MMAKEPWLTKPYLPVTYIIGNHGTASRDCQTMVVDGYLLYRQLGGLGDETPPTMLLTSETPLAKTMVFVN